MENTTAAPDQSLVSPTAGPTQEMELAELQGHLIDLMAQNRALEIRELPKFVFGEVPVPGVFSNALTTVRSRNALGMLAAPHVGFPFRAFCLAGIDTCLFNPVIVYRSVDTSVEAEMNVSQVGLKVKVRRHNTIRLRYQDFQGNFQMKTFNGLSARLIQQAVDEFDGIGIIKRADRFHREQAIRQWNRYKKHNAS